MARRVLRHALARAALAAGVGLTGMSAQAAEPLQFPEDTPVAV